MSDPHVDAFNPGEPSEPRPAAAVILMRRGGRHDAGGLEVLLGRRTPKARFMAGVWVFPGGAVDGGATDDLAHRLTALRELEEEVGVHIEDAGSLVPFARWITPAEVRTRFDTWFYLVTAPAHCKPAPDGEEIVEADWFSPAEALERCQAGDLQLVFPTIRQLEELARFESPGEALEATAATEVEPILPKVVVGEDGPQVLLPWEPGYPAD
jgi:8-oxo-dGTP pyrophosphatase MutT (NUDIX family)